MPGWQAEHDSFKLFEMGYYCGDVILEIGVYSGRSAAVSLLGALSNPMRTTPRYFGIDIELEAVVCGTQHLAAMGLADHAILFCGDANQFLSQISLTPTMVFVDGDHSYEGTKGDLTALTPLLAPGTPVLCHDWHRPTSGVNVDLDAIETPPTKNEVVGENMWIGVQKATNEWVRDGFATYAGAFGCCALFVTSSKCGGQLKLIDDKDFTMFRDGSRMAYLKAARARLEDIAARTQP